MRFAILILVFAVACKDRPADLPSTEAEKRAFVDKACPIVKHPYFYRVDKDGKTSYLLGTRHISIALSKFPPSVTELVVKQRLLVFETPPDAPDKGKLPDNLPHARAALGRETWQRYVELVGPKMADVVAEKPVVLAGLMVDMQFENLGHALEKELWEAAKSAKVASGGLETDDFQTDLLVRMMDVRLIRAAIANTTGREEIRDDLAKEISSYCAGVDKPAFDANTERDLKTAGYSQAEIDAYEEALIYGRNRSWIPKLEAMFADGGVFVAVGAAHLRGDRGVPALLRAEGYTVTRVED